MSQLDAIKQMVGELLTDPSQHEIAKILGDWCEERGFVEQASILRLDPFFEGGPPRSFDPMERRLLLSGLRTFLGSTGPSLSGLRTFLGSTGPSGVDSWGRYSAVCGFPSVAISCAETVRFETEPQAAMRLRKIFVPLTVADYLQVEDIRVGIRTMLFNSQSVHGSLFTLAGPDLFYEMVYPGQRIIFTVTNISNVRIDVHVGALGDSLEFEEQRQRAYEARPLELDSPGPGHQDALAGVRTLLDPRDW